MFMTPQYQEIFLKFDLSCVVLEIKTSDADPQASNLELTAGLSTFFGAEVGRPFSIQPAETC
jgi:hypothetical protein